MTNETFKIGVLTSGMLKASNTPLSHIIYVLSSISTNIYLITGNEGYLLFKNDPRVHTLGATYKLGRNPVTKVFKYIYGQVLNAYYLVRASKDVDVWIFFLGGEHMILPMLSAKLLNKSVLLVLTGSTVNDARFTHDIFLLPIKLLSSINCAFSNKIVLYSPCLVQEWNLEKYHHKVRIAHEHFLDFNTFTVTTPLPDRSPLIGYIGRLSGEKGVQYFVKALPTILSDRQDLRVLIGGDGQLKEAIEASLQEGGVTARVDLPGWISHDDLPNYLNQLRLLVLPSYTEGLPNIMLEAMACGTPVLVTPVGAIPDVIRDGKTGFIMENNSPECIAENVIRALNSPDLEEIAEAGRRFVEENFSFESTVARWREVLEGI
jgi:glycosyltransferase involved in cell wall biosynthesis